MRGVRRHHRTLARADERRHYHPQRRRRDAGLARVLRGRPRAWRPVAAHMTRHAADRAEHTGTRRHSPYAKTPPAGPHRIPILSCLSQLHRLAGSGSVTRRFKQIRHVHGPTAVRITPAKIPPTAGMGGPMRRATPAGAAQLRRRRADRPEPRLNPARLSRARPDLGRPRSHRARPVEAVESRRRMTDISQARNRSGPGRGVRQRPPQEANLASGADRRHPRQRFRDEFIRSSRLDCRQEANVPHFPGPSLRPAPRRNARTASCVRSWRYP